MKTLEELRQLRTDPLGIGPPVCISASNANGLAEYTVDKRDLLIGLTISFSPKKCIPEWFISKSYRKRLPKKPQWGDFTPVQQCDVLQRYLERYVYPLIDISETHFEMHKSGILHSHSMLIMKNELKHLVYNMKQFQKDMDQSFKVSGEASKRMIHNFHVTRVTYWKGYCRKDEEEIPLKPVYKNINAYLKFPE